MLARRLREVREAQEAAAVAAAAEKEQSRLRAEAAVEAERVKALETKGKRAPARTGLKAAASKATSANSVASTLNKRGAARRDASSTAPADGKQKAVGKEAVAGSGAAAAKALATAATSSSDAKEQPAERLPAPAIAASDTAVAISAPTPAAFAPAADAASTVPSTAAKTEESVVDVEHLASAVAQAKAERANGGKAPDSGPLNERSVSARLGLVHVSRALGEPLLPLRPMLEEALAADTAARHDAGLYEELGRILRDEEPMAAVDLYCSFPFSSDHDFGENALRLAAIKLLLAQRRFDDERLPPLLVSIGKGFGVRQVADEMDVLDRAGKTDLCKAIYMGITGLSEERSRGFFQSKGWAAQFTSSEIAAGSFPTLRGL